MSKNKILPGTGRGTIRRMVVGALRQCCARCEPPPPLAARAVPLPMNGEELS